MLTIIEFGKKTTNKSFEYNIVFFFKRVSQFEFSAWSRIDHVDISTNSLNREKSARELVALLC